MDNQLFFHFTKLSFFITFPLQNKRNILYVIGVKKNRNVSVTVARLTQRGYESLRS
jgi:hypothetical protein